MIVIANPNFDLYEVATITSCVPVLYFGCTCVLLPQQSNGPLCTHMVIIWRKALTVLSALHGELDKKDLLEAMDHGGGAGPVLVCDPPPPFPPGF